MREYNGSDSLGFVADKYKQLVNKFEKLFAKHGEHGFFDDTFDTFVRRKTTFFKTNSDYYYFSLKALTLFKNNREIILNKCKNG